MLGWFDALWHIRIPIRTFLRPGWSDPIYQHELTHWVLNTASPYGAAEQALLHLRLVARALADGSEVAIEELSARMSKSSFVTQESVATLSGLDSASAVGPPELFQDMLDSLDTTYRECYEMIARLMDDWHVPEGARARIATFVGLIALGSDVLEDWSDEYLDFPELVASIDHHSPDIRFQIILETLSAGPPLWEQWLAAYQQGGRPPIPHSIARRMSCRILGQGEEWPAIVATIKAFAPRLTRQLRAAGSADPESGAAALVSHAVQSVNRLARFPANPTWKVSVVPDQFGVVSVQEPEIPTEVWRMSQLVSICPNDLPYPIPRGASRSAFDTPGVLMPDEAEVTVYTEGTTYRFIAHDRTRLKSELKSVGTFPAVLLHAEPTLRSVYSSLLKLVPEDTGLPQNDPPTGIDLARKVGATRGLFLQGRLPTECPVGLIFIGCFADLLELISPFVHSKHPAECIVMPSATAERHAAGFDLRALNVGAFGYAAFKFAVPEWPILYWPVPVFVAEAILSDRASMRKLGINISDQIAITGPRFFDPPSEVLPMIRLRQHFEQLPDPLKTSLEA